MDLCRSIGHVSSETISENTENRQEELRDKEGELDDVNENDSDFHDSEYEISDDDELFEINIDEGIESGMGKGKEQSRNLHLVIGEDNEVYSDYGESDELISIDGYSDEDCESNHKRLPEFRIEADMDNPKFALGMLFGSKGEFRDAVKEYGIKNRVNGHKMWPKSSIICLPPMMKNQPGRPKKKRKKSTNEDEPNSQKMRKAGGKSTCSICKQGGHNARTCKMTPNDVNRQSKIQKLPIRKKTKNGGAASQEALLSEG